MTLTGRRPLAVFDPGSEPDGDLATSGQTAGWGTRDPVPWRRRSTAGFAAPVVSAGILLSPATQAQAIVTLDTPTPDRGRVDWQTIDTPGQGLLVDLLGGIGAGGLVSPTGDAVLAGVFGGVVVATKLDADGSSTTTYFPTAEQAYVAGASRLALTWDSPGGTYRIWYADTEVGQVTGWHDPRGLQAGCMLGSVDPSSDPDAPPVLLRSGLAWLALSEQVEVGPTADLLPDTLGAAGWSATVTTRRGRPVAAWQAGFTATWRLPDPHDLALPAVDAVGPDAGKVRELASDLVVAVDGRPRLRTRIGPASDDLTVDGAHTVGFTGHDYRARLDRRILWPHQRLNFVAVPALEVARSLLGDTMVMDGGDDGIRLADGLPAGPLVTQQFTPGQSLRQALDLTFAAAPEAHWDIDPWGLLHWWPDGRGVDRGLVLEWGRNVLAAGGPFASSEYANAVRYTDSNGAGGQHRIDPVGVVRYGRWEQTGGDPDAAGSTAAARADRAFALASQPFAPWTAQLDPAWWTPARLWIGDRCTWRLQSGRLRLDEPVLVYELAVTVGPDDPGPLTVEVTLARPRPNGPLQRARDRRRLAQLERR